MVSKSIIILFLFCFTQEAQGIHRSIRDFKPQTMTEMMDSLFEKTVFSANHNTIKDRAFLTDTFYKYAMLGQDQQG